jgi:hypothetical protein
MGLYHGETIAANEASMIPHIVQVFQERGPFRENVDGQSLSLQSRSQFVIKCPIFHWPHRAGDRSDRDVSR